MKRFVKGLFCSFLSISMMTQYCLPIFAQDITDEETIEVSNEESTITSEDLLNKIDEIKIQNRENTSKEVKIDVTFNDDSNISNVSLNVEKEETISLENPEIQNEKDEEENETGRILYTFTSEFEVGNYSIESISLTYNDEEYKIDLNEKFNDLSFEVEEKVEVVEDENNESEVDNEETSNQEETIKINNESSGTCGDNLIWALDDNGTLTISGSGKMKDYWYGGAPWYDSYKSSIKKVIIEKGVTSIGNYAFIGCSNLAKIEISDSVTSIGGSAFYNCSGLTSVTIPSDVTSISNSAFYNCSGLTSITIPSEVTSIGGSAFSGCSGLTSVTIPSKATSIGGSAFSGCSGLTSVTIPSEVTSIGDFAFSACTRLTNIEVDKNNTVYDSRNNCNAIINTDEDELVAGCKGTKIPETVKKIGNYAFYNCSGLTSITIPSEVTSIGGSAFNNCSGLTSVTIPSKVTSIGDFAFSACTRLTNIEVDKNNTVYDSRNNCNAIINTDEDELVAGCKGTKIPETVKKIGNYAFYSCYGLKSIEIPDSVTSIGEAAFYACTGLTSVTISSNVTSISNSVFNRCSGLTSVTIPSKVKSIGDFAFYCSGLTSVTIPSDVTSIGMGAFGDCDGLTSVTIPKNVESIDGTMFSRTGLETIYLYKDSKADQYFNANPKNDIYKNTYNIVYIDEGPFSLDSYTVTLDSSIYTYNGKAKKPYVTVKNGSITLANGTDYTVSYSNNIEVGTATVTVTGIGNYSGTLTKEFTITAENINSGFVWSEDNWNFTNTSDYFGSGTYANMISSEYSDVLKSNLNNNEYSNVFDRYSGWLYDDWYGSCYGLSSLALLSLNGLLPDTAKVKLLNDLESPSPDADSDIKSLITYYQMLQIKNVMWQQPRIVSYKTNEENITNIINLLDSYPSVLIGFKNTSLSHAVLAYGVEYGSYKYGGVTYQGCIKIWDPNYSDSYNPKANLYFNTETYDWTIPVYSNMTSTGGAKFTKISASTDDINEGGYLEGSKEKSNDSTKNSFVARLFDDAETAINVSKVTKNENGDYEENSTGDNSGIKQDVVTGTGIAYNLDDAESSYMVTQDKAADLQLKLSYEDIALKAESSAGKCAIFDKSGYVEITSYSSTDFALGMVCDDDYPTDWFAIKVDGTGTNKASLEKLSDGYLLTTADNNLNNVQVLAYNKSEEVNTAFSTGQYKKVLICEDNGELVAKVDADGDGVYETSLNKENSKYDCQLEGYTVSLSGNIGVNFYMHLNDQTINDKKAYMEFTLSNNETQRININGLEANADGSYVFPCSMSVKEMTEPIKAQIHYSNGTVGEEYSYTVEQYANYILGHSSSYSSKDVSIAKAMLTYGYYTQDYFGYNTDTKPSDINELSNADLSSYAYNKEDKNDSIDFVGARLVLTSKPGLKLYFKGTGTFSVDGNVVSTTTEGKYTVVTISDIDDMTNMYSITTDNFKLTYGIFSYGYVASKTSNTDLKNLIYAMYAYDQALKS